jgi:hypothetical protein
MSGGKGGSQSTQVEIPKYLEDASKENIAMGKEVAKIGYTPYYGPDVAALTPAQEAARANIGSMASAFGMQGPTSGMPAATDFGDGIRGYSSGSLYEQALEELKSRRPGQYAAINQMFIDPQTGAYTGKQNYYNNPYGAYGFDPSNLRNV